MSRFIFYVRSEILVSVFRVGFEIVFGDGVVDGVLGLGVRVGFCFFGFYFR